jgi:hypothetical protein
MADWVLRVLRDLWAALEPLGFPKAVMGGIAVSMWKHLRATQDVDVLAAVRPEEEAALIAHLEAAGFRRKREPPIVPLGDYRLLQLLYEPPGSHLPIQTDLLLVSSAYHIQALARSVPAALADGDPDVMVLACEDLILHKLVAGRIIDRADVGALLRANRRSLDFDYLSLWAACLGVAPDLATVWDEAFPGEALPS